MTFELFPAGNGQFLQLILPADDLEAATLWAVVDGQSQSPVAFLRDHPVVHIAQPVQFALKTKGRYPVDLAYDIHDLVTKLLHRDEPLINEAEDQLGFTAPARWVAVLIVLRAIEQPFLHQVFSDLLSNFSRVLSCEP